MEQYLPWLNLLLVPILGIVYQIARLMFAYEKRMTKVETLMEYHGLDRKVSE